MTVTREQILQAMADASFYGLDIPARRKVWRDTVMMSAFDAIHPLTAVVDRADFDAVNSVMPEFQPLRDLAEKMP
jgi:hypothetical protein